MNRNGERWLVIGAHNPYPAKSGSALRIRQHVETLAKQGAKVLYWGLAEPGEDRQNVRIVRTTPWSGLSRWQKLARVPAMAIGLAAGRDPHITFLTDGGKARVLDHAVFEFRPTHLLVCETWMAEYVYRIFNYMHEHRWNIRVVLDLHNFEPALRRQVSPGIMGLIRSAATLQTERQLSTYTDEVWVCSKGDMDLAKKIYTCPIAIVPNKVNLNMYSDVGGQRHLRTFGMVGIWSYAPNGNAAKILLDVVWPDLKGVPILIGKNPTERMKMASGKGAVVTGEVDDVRPHLAQIRTMVIPLMEGGGTRMKVLEAMAAGVPVVATPKAVEGLEVEDMVHCVICQPEDMAKNVQRLWDNPKEEQRLRENARELVRKKYSW